MAEIVPFEPRKRMRRTAEGIEIIKKVIDGKIVEYINLDELTPQQRARYFEQPDPPVDSN